jgi:tetratricopeptide (TPR) repeat protein
LKAYILHSIFFLLTALTFGSPAWAQKSKPLTEQQQIEFDKTYINANKEKLINNLDEAIKLFKICLTFQPDNAAVNYALSQLYEEKQLHEDAELYAKRAVNFDEKNTWYKKQLAEVYKQRKKYKDAAPVYLRIANQEQDAGMEIEAAYMYILANEYKKAVRTLDDVEKKAGVNEEIIKQKEQIYLAQNKLKKAIQEIQKLIRANPQETKYIGMLADLYMANKKPEKALELYNEVLKLDPQNGFALLALADYHHSKGDMEQFFSNLKAGIASKTLDVKSKLTVMVNFIASKDFADQHNRCFELARIFIQANPTEASAYMVLGDLYASDKDYESARTEYLKAVSFDPSSHLTWQQIIFCSSELRNNVYLQKDCEQALEYFPNDAAFYVYHGVASMQLKDYEKAFTSAQKGIEFAADQKDILIQLYATLGDAAHYLKRYTACDSAFEEALKLDSNNSYALNNYAYFLSLRKVNLDKAERLSKRSMDLEPENSSFMDTYGWILYQEKEYPKAKEYIEKSLMLTPNSAEVVEHLGDIQYRLNLKEDAVKSWMRAKELGGTGEFLDKKIADKLLHE